MRLVIGDALAYNNYNRLFETAQVPTNIVAATWKRYGLRIITKYLIKLCY